MIGIGREVAAALAGANALVFGYVFNVGNAFFKFLLNELFKFLQFLF